MRPLHLFSAVVFAGAASAAVACNFIVDAQFSGKTQTAQDGSLPPSSCTLGSGSPQDPACGQCMLTACSQYWEAMCKDGTNATGRSTLGACSDDPSVASGNCERVWLPEAGPYATPNDPQTHYFNMRKCTTESCRASCTTCEGMMYDRYPGDTKGAPLANNAGACAKCLLSSCASALIGKGTQFSHCCYQSRIDDTWGPCVRDPQANPGDQAPDCSNIVKYAATDAGTSTGCNEILSVCAAQNCSSECNL